MPSDRRAGRLAASGPTRTQGRCDSQDHCPPLPRRTLLTAAVLLAAGVPAARADVLLEMLPENDGERGGGAMDVSDPRLVIGDACDMPFDDQAFDYVIASHIAEHVDDPDARQQPLPAAG